jgi:hypothetical protein
MQQCASCGSPLEWVPQQQYRYPDDPYGPPYQGYAEPPKSLVAAGLLAFFVGSLGIHNFYLGYQGRGVAQLLLTLLTCGFGGIITGPWAFIEGILILTGSIPDADGRPLRG